ncbi:MAG: PLP-dependent aminotransferase family protein [Actinomycetia bacterium]|nr:PLP-dependent aminotransferase family protein [Actinomycetes bacterium]
MGPEHLSSRARSAQSSAIRDLLRHARRPDVISLAGGIPDPALFPVEEMQAGFAATLEQSGPDALQYGLTEGLTELRQWISADSDRRDGVVAEADRIVVTTGSQQGLDLLGRVLIDPGDAIVVEDPGYIGALQSLRGHEPEMVGIPLDTDGMDTAELERRLEAGLRPVLCYLNPTFQNPTGATLSRERRHHLVELAHRFDFLVLEDDPYGELRYDGQGLPSMASLDDRGDDTVVVRLRSLSKVLAPGIRVGWTVGPGWLMDAVVIAKQAVDLHTSTLSQHVAYRVLAEPGFLANHVELLQASYRPRRDALLEGLERSFGDRLEVNQPEGGMFVWGRFVEPINTTELLAVALDSGVAFVPGDAFAVDRPALDQIRLSFATEPPARLIEATSRLAAAVATAGH